MDKKLTDSEIVKGLECCVNEKTCKNCAYNGRLCMTPLKRDALDLINRLQAENESLKDFATAKCEDCAGCTSWKCDCANTKAEAYKEFAERLKAIPSADKDVQEVFEARINNILKELVGDGDGG